MKRDYTPLAGFVRDEMSLPRSVRTPLLAAASSQLVELRLPNRWIQEITASDYTN